MIKPLPLPRAAAPALAGPALLAWLAACGPAAVEDAAQDHAYDPGAAGPGEAITAAATRCPARLERYPVRGAHNGGWDRNALTFTCAPHPGHAADNSDFYKGSGPNHADGHFGNDIFGAKGTPIVAGRAGTVVRTSTPAQNPAGGITVTVRDDCGWDYYYAHLDSASARVGARVAAGDVIGALGKTGNAQGTSPHLHFSIFPAGSYTSGVDPFPALRDADATACAAAPPPPSLPPPTPPTGCGALRPGQGLGHGQAAVSCDGRFHLSMQADGNLVLYQVNLAGGPRALWSTRTNGQPAFGVYLQGDGNLVLYTRDGRPLWASGTDGNPGASLAVQDDGNVVVYGARALWASHTCCR